LKQPTQANHDLGRLLIARETAAGASPTDTVAAAEAILRNLEARLTILLGREGFHSLLGRALHLAEREHPILKAVAREAAPQGDPAAGVPLKGLRESTAGGEPAALAEALAALIGNFVWLLARFIGRGTTLRELRRIWPALSFPEAGPGTEEARE
jgi:D-tyrosyl-tRNA(Tyr) deacylase